MLQLILATAVLVLIFNWLFSKPSKFPPGPPRWPLFGNLIEVFLYSKGKGKHEIFSSLSEQYGGIMGLYLGSQPTVVVTDPKLIREMSSIDNLCGRPISSGEKLINKEGKKYGIIFNHGEDWREQRRFSLRHMKDLGFGKMSMETIIHEEVEELLREVAQKAGPNFSCPVELYDVLGVASINVLWYIIAKERYSHSDARVSALTKLIKDISSKQDAAGSGYSHFPWLLNVMPGKLAKLQQFLGMRERLFKFIKERIDEHKEALDMENPRDFIDIYLTEIKNSTEEVNSSYSDDQLLAIIFDMFMAGFDTTFNSMAFALVYMVRYPEVQAKVQEEIDAVIGRNRLPSLLDRSSLPYVEATIEEVFRMSSVIPLGVPHAVLYANKNISFHDYEIPAKTRILFNLAHLHHDKTLWKDPQNFRPDRFITSENKVKRPEYLIPFGYGKRQCLGETLARSNMFLFFTSIMQKFELSVPDGSKPPESRDTEGAFTLGPKPYKAKFTPRF